jgi:hypothetical protein
MAYDDDGPEKPKRGEPRDYDVIEPTDAPEKPKRGSLPLYDGIPGRTAPPLADRLPGGDSGGRMIGALVLIGLGIVFLLMQNGVVMPNFNWWSLFIFIPGIALLAKSVAAYRHFGYLTQQARAAITGGTITTFVGSIFLFNLDWGKVWPVFIIIPGIFMLLGLSNTGERRAERTARHEQHRLEREERREERYAEKEERREERRNR